MGKTKIIVTGGAGFIGSHLTDFLIEKYLKVLVIDNLSSGSKKNINPKTIFKKIDIQDKKKVDKIFKKFSPDFVFHLAAITSKEKSQKEINKVNVLGTINILEACVKNNVGKIIFASSAAVYGNAKKFPIIESSKLAPIDLYGISKVKAEQEILKFSKKYNLKYSILRYSNVYGPKQRSGSEGGVVAIFCKNISKNKKISIYGDGNQTRDFIFIDDVINANYQSLLSPINFIANLSTKKEINITHLAKIIEKTSNKKIKIIFKPYNKNEIIRSYLDNSLIKQKINWKLKMKLVSGIKKTYYWHIS